MKRKIITLSALLAVAAAITTSHAQPGMKYPYVENGRTIVSRDQRGGVKKELLRAKSLAEPEINYPNGPYNLVPERFEVASEDISESGTPWSKALCSNWRQGWRLPTQRELILMYVLKDKLVPKMKDNIYWSSTTYAGGYIWFVNFKISDWNLPLLADFTDPNYSRYVRCVRTVE